MDMMIAPGEGYIPAYTRTDITEALHNAFGFRTDYQITSQKNMRKILNQTKKNKNSHIHFDKESLTNSAFMLVVRLLLFLNCQRLDYIYYIL